MTGSNTGLGLEAAKHLVALGAAKVILGVRDVNAGEVAKTEIEKETGKTHVAEVVRIIGFLKLCPFSRTILGPPP